MKGDVSLLILISNINVLFGVMNFLTIAISENNADIVFPDNLYPLYNVTPISYNVTLTLDQQLQKERCHIYFDGQCNIEIYIKHSTYDIKLDAQEPNVAVYYAYVVVGAKKHRAEVKREGKSSLILHLSLLIHGNVKLEIIFGSCVYDTDVHRILDMKQEFNMKVMATHLLPTRTRALFPCFDDIRLKACFTINLIVDDINNATLNTNRRNVVYDGLKGMKMLSFHQTANISTYDIAIIIYDKTYISSDRCRFAVPNHIEFADTISVNVGKNLGNTWEIFRVSLKPSSFIIPGLPYDAVTKPGLIMFREDAFLYNSDMDSFATKIEVVRLVSRVVVHEKLKNIISPNQWDHLWINEGIAMLLGQYIADKLLPELRLFDLFVVQFHQESLRLESEDFTGLLMPTVKSGMSINSLFSFFYYIKAPVILNVIRRVTSDEIFWKSVQKYLTDNKEASVANFCHAMESIIEEANATICVPFFDASMATYAWTHQTQYNVVKVTQETNSSRIKIRTKNVMGLPLDYLLLTMTTQSNLNFELNSDRIHGVWVESEGEYVYQYFKNPNKDDWIMFNSQQLGYYRVDYDIQNWQKIANYLNSDNYTNVHVLNRAQIIDDAFHFLLTDQMDLTIFFDLMNYLAHETDYVALYPLFKRLEYVSGYLPYEGSTFFKEKFESILTKLFLKITMREYMVSATSDDISDCLRQEVAKWACNFGSGTCTYFVKYILGLANLRKHVLPLWKNWVFCKGMMGMEMKAWKEFLFAYLDTADNKIFEFLVCSEDPQIILTYINLMLYNNTVYTQLSIHDRVYSTEFITDKGRKSFINIFHSIVVRHAKSTPVLEYLLNNILTIAPRQIGRLVALTGIINHVYSKNHLDKIVDHAKFENFRGSQLVIKKANLVRAAQIKNHQQRFKSLRKNDIF